MWKIPEQRRGPQRRGRDMLLLSCLIGRVRVVIVGAFQHSQLFSRLAKEFTEFLAKIEAGERDPSFPATHVGRGGSHHLSYLFLRPGVQFSLLPQLFSKHLHRLSSTLL